MDRRADLDSALSFVIGRIGEQALRSGEPLSEEQRRLLNNLPSSTAVPIGLDPEYQMLVPRNVDYERLCSLGKTAYLHDRQVNPASPDWDFAFAVFTLNRHPMWGLLKWAGVKQRRPRGDRLVLFLTALLPVLVLMLPAWNAPWSFFKLSGICSLWIAITLLIYFAARLAEAHRLEEEIQRCMFASRFVSTAG